MSLIAKLEDARQIIEQAIDEYQPRAIFSLLSGGHDSLTVTHFANAVLGKRLTGTVHINTGIGIAETREFVRHTCRAFGWRLLEYKATENRNGNNEPDPQRYEDIVIKYGFPGPAGHTVMYSRLKERPLRCLIRDHKEKFRDNIMLLTGVRKAESDRRFRNVTGVQKEDAKIWVPPFADFTDDDQAEYMRLYELPRNPVKDTLCMSGECLCGAFAKPEEFAEIKALYPDTAAEIERIEEVARLAGQPNHTWGVRPKTERQIEELGGAEHMCSSCHFRNSLRSESDG